MVCPYGYDVQNVKIPCENLCEKIVPKPAKMAKIGKNVEFIYLIFLII